MSHTSSESSNNADNAESAESLLAGAHFRVQSFHLDVNFCAHFINTLSDFEVFATRLIAICNLKSLNENKDDRAAIKILKTLATKVIEVHPSWKEHVVLFVNKFIENSDVRADVEEFTFL